MKKFAALLLFAASFTAVFSQRIISDTLLKTFTKTEVDSILTANGVPAIFPTTYDIEVHKIIYNTVSYDSSATYASGMMAVPVGGSCKMFPMAVYEHGTETEKSEAPSRLGGEEPVVGMVMASIGYITCEPDYLGLGDGPGLHPYQHAQTEASATIDMLRSAREYCDSNNIHRNGQLFLMGYSEGGHACMATHRAIQTQLNGEFNVTAAVPMSGAYDMSGVMVQTMLSDSPYAQPGYLPYLVLSWEPIYHIYDSIQDALIYPYDSTLPPLFDGSYDINVVNSAMPAVPKYIFTSSEYDTFVNNLTSPFRLALAANDVYGWVPACPTRLLFCKADTYVPYMNSVVCIDSMRARGAGANIDTMDVNALLGHVACAQYAIFYAESFFAGYMTIDDYPAAPVTGSLFICPGGMTVLHAPADSTYSYQWLASGSPVSGATTSSLSVTGAGRYSVVVTQGSCVNTSSSDSVAIVPFPTPVISGTTMLCPGGSVGLHATVDSGAVYQWLNGGSVIAGADSSVYEASVAGSYSVVQTVLGCPGTSASVMVVTDTLLPVITMSGQMLTSSPGLFYEWYDGGQAVSGATQQSFMPAATGTYTVSVQDSAGCIHQSLPFSFTTGINSVSADAILIYPNPVKDVLTIEGNFSSSNITADLYDMDGREIQAAALHNGSNNVAINSVSPGVYVLKIADGSNVAKVVRVVVE